MEEEEEEEVEEGVTDEFSPVVELDSAKSNGVRPIAQLSMDDDEYDKVTGDEGMMSEVEDGRFSGVVKVPSFGAQESVDVAPLVKRDNGADSGVLGPKDAVVSNGSVSDSGSVKLVEDNGQDVTVIQLTNMGVNGDSLEYVEGDKMEDVRESNTNSSGIEDEANRDSETMGEQKGLLFDDEIEELNFGGSGTTKLIMNELERNLAFSSPPGTEAYHDHPHMIDGEITMDSDEDTDSDDVEEPVGKQLFDSAALAALLKAATGAELDGGRITLSSVDGSVLSSLENSAGSGFLFRPRRHAPPPDVDSLPEDSIVESVLHRLDPYEGRRDSREFSLETAKSMAMQLEAEGKDDLDFSLNILALGKTGVGKSATINSIFGEKRVEIDAFAPATTRVNEIVGTIDGVKIRIIDTPGLRSSVKEEATNRKILSSVKKLINKFPPDVVLYVDRLDIHDRDLNDLLLLNLLSRTLTPSIWKNAIVTLTHATSPPSDGPSGSSLAFEVYVAQRSRVIQQAITQSVGDPYLMHLSMKHPVSLVENHSLCQKNENGENVLPNGQSWRPQLLLLCYSLKVLSEANSISKPQDLIDHKKSFGFRLRSLPLPHLVSSLLQSRPPLKLPSDLGGDIDSDMDLVDLPDSDAEDEDEYDQLPPFKPLRKSQVQKLSKEQKKAYFEEYDYRKWTREDEGPASVPVPLPDFVLPQSFDSDNPSYRYRALEPASQFLVRPVLDAQGWDHDYGYDGVNIESNLAIADSSICVKHGESGSTMVGFDIQNIGRQRAYILRSQTELKKFKMNKPSAGISVTLLGENVATGFKIGDQIAVGERLALVGNAGTVRSGSDTAYGANFESQFSIGRNSQMAVHVGMNNKRSGQISIKTSSSELQAALIGIVPIAVSLLKSIYPGSNAGCANILDY
ncbi:TRANSLOCASE OF CHLOROPLAST 159 CHLOROPLASTIC-LIKE [Salix koriyanagi]|uniref:TRANSLOCASE OF CHLOROPLAST 159 CHLOROPLASTIC-LIKE n=1 Tax=Salix koriyanagi TaxID=2511006 RepID=A0A9Q1AGX2_9ROSI|nr:TRANSLOCASE OF CHLOROPLAST 159 CHLOROPLASTIC-LIKE [Salix koriyanagi]